MARMMAKGSVGAKKKKKVKKARKRVAGTKAQKTIRQVTRGRTYTRKGRGPRAKSAGRRR